jgi:AraC-like DNA-binding protein
LQIELPLPAAGWAEACAPYFPTTPRCGMPSLRFGIPNELLDLPCPTADTEAHAAAMRQCALDTLSLSGKLSERVAAYLAQQEGNYPTLHAMASDFCMSERSLSRNLQCEGVTYQGLLDEARQASAERYLVQTNLSIDQIAECLGYTDPSNFVRAFRRWVGMTPGAYRKGNS